MAHSNHIDASSLDQPYASIDVSAFDPLLIDTSYIEAIAKTLTHIPLSDYPTPFLATWATSLGEADKSWFDALDLYDPSRVFMNALRACIKPKSEKILLQLKQNLSGTRLSISNKDTRTTLLEGVFALLEECTKEHIKQSISNDDQNAAQLAGELETALRQEPSSPTWTEKWRALEKRSKDLEALFDRYNQSMVKATPIGLMHRYRQHFFYSKLVNGPIELIRTLAPNEELEVVLTESVETTREDQLEQEIEVSLSQSTEQKTSNELTERVSRSVTMGATSTISTEGSYTAVFSSGGGSASTTSSNSSTQTNESMAKRLQEITTKQSEQVRKKSRVSTRNVETRRSSNLTRHVIRNTSNDPVSYGMKKLGYNVKSVIQDIGPYMVWQTKIHRPGRSLALAFHQDLIVREATFDPTPNTVPVTVSLSSSGNNNVDHVYINVGKSFLDAINEHFDSLQKDPILRGRPEIEGERRKNIESLMGTSNNWFAKAGPPNS